MPAKRAYGIDQDFYPWSPIVTRPVLPWPDNARVALAVLGHICAHTGVSKATGGEIVAWFASRSA